MEILTRDVPAQHVVVEQRSVDQPRFVVIYEGNPNEGETPVEVCATVADAGEKWIGEQGLVVAAAPRETYWTDFHAAGAQDPVFDVAFPVAARG